MYSSSSIEHNLLDRKLNEIIKIVDEKATHGRPRRFVEGQKDKADNAAFARAISDLITHLQVRSASNPRMVHSYPSQSELTLYNCRGINELLSVCHLSITSLNCGVISHLPLERIPEEIKRIGNGKL
jgi:hypothetical protein